MKRLIFASALLAVLAAATMLFGPAQVGGGVSYVVTSGNSMEPRLHDGDLVLVRSAGTYEVGDIVAYNNAELNSPVLHRIIAMDGDRFVFQGDNNDFIDSYHPTADELIGKHWILVPAGGKVLRAVATPRVAAAIAVLLGLTIPGSFAVRRRKRSHQVLPPTESTGEIVPPTDKYRRAAAPLAIAIALFAVLGVLAFRQPATRSVRADVDYENSGRFDYHAAVPDAGDVYDDGTIDTGEPIYRSIVDRVEFAFTYSFGSQAETDLSGTGSMEARLSSADGWSRTFTLSPETSFTGPTTSMTGTLDLAKLERVITNVEQRTGFIPGLYNIDIVPKVAFEGTVDAEPVAGKFSPKLSFTLDATKAQLVQSGIDASEASSINPVEAASVERTGTEAARVGLMGLNVATEDARRIALAGTGLMLVLGLILALGYVRAREDETEGLRILSRFPDRFVPVKSFDSFNGLPAVELTSIEGLIKLADAQERMVLYVPQIPLNTFVLEQGGVVYYFSIDRTEAPLDDNVAPEQPAPVRAMPPPPPPLPSEALPRVEHLQPEEIDVR